MNILHTIFMVIPWLIIVIMAVVYYLSWNAYTGYLRNIKKKLIGVVQEDWAVLALGITDRKLEIVWLRAAQMLFKSFAHKNHDYGATNISSGGVRGIAFRLGDKVSRLWQLAGLRGKDSGAKVTSESIADTFLDLTNYGLIGYLMATGKWPGGSINQSVGSKAIAEILIGAMDGLDETTQDEILAAVYTAKVAKDIGSSSVTFV